jgi:hypothetical protein
MAEAVGSEIERVTVDVAVDDGRGGRGGEIERVTVDGGVAVGGD